jgi:hypothetical protein
MTVPLMTGMREEAEDVPPQGDLGSPKDSEEAEELEMLRLRAVPPEDAVCARDVSAEASATNVRDTADAVASREKLTPARAADAARLIFCVWIKIKSWKKEKRSRGKAQSMIFISMN